MGHPYRIARRSFARRGSPTLARGMDRACWRALYLFAISGMSGCGQSEAGQPFQIVEATIPAMQQAMEEGRTTSRELI